MAPASTSTKRACGCTWRWTRCPGSYCTSASSRPPTLRHRRMLPCVKFLGGCAWTTVGPECNLAGMRRILPVTGLACGFLITVALAQGPAPPAQVPPVFRSDTRLVEVSVVVHDKSGAPVAGLTRGDFTLYDEGKEQRIELFSVDSDQTVGSAPVLAPGEYSNRTEGRTSGAVTVVLFDRINTSLADQRQARDQVVKVLGQIRREDRVALYVLDSTSLRMLHDFTSDSTSLIRVFSKQPAREAPEINTLDAGDRPLD